MDQNLIKYKNGKLYLTNDNNKQNDKIPNEKAISEIDSSGYFVISIRVNGVPNKLRVHSLVYAYFHGLESLDNNLIVVYKDGNKENYSIENLKLMSRSELFKVMEGNGTFKTQLKKGYDNSSPGKLSKIDVLNIFDSIWSQEKTSRALAREFNVHPKVIYNIKYKKTYKEWLPE